MFLVCALLAAPAQDLAALEKALATGSDKERRAAVQELAAQGSAEAWRLLLSALDDPEPRVADEAELQLGRVRIPEFESELFGKEALGARDEWVRLRVAEALGRLEWDVSAEELARALGAREPALRRTLCASTEALADARHLAGPAPEVADLRARVAKAAERDKDARTRAAALCALAALDGELEPEVLAPWLAHELPELRAAALLCSGRLGPVERLQTARTALADAALSVRTCAVEELARLATKPALAALVDALEKEPSERLRWTIVEALRGLSGLAYRLDPRPWRAWVEGLPPEWTPAAGGGSGAGPGRAPDGGERESASFAGLPLRSQRVAFLIDFSGSMWQERGGRTRKEVVDGELRRALEALPPETEFNVIPYTDSPLPWRKGLVPASPKNVASALADFERNHARGKGNFWDAALLALEDPRVDTLVVLTDGAPTGGRRWNLELMRHLFAAENRFRRVALSAVLVDCPKGLEKHWAAMCAASHGSWLETDLR